MNSTGSTWLDNVGLQMVDYKPTFGSAGTHKATICGLDTKEHDSGSKSIILKYKVDFKKNGKTLTQSEYFCIMSKTGQVTGFIDALKQRLIQFTDNDETKEIILKYKKNYYEIVDLLMEEGKVIKLTFTKNPETGYLEIEKPKYDKKAIIPPVEEEVKQEIKVKEETKSNKKRKTSEAPVTPQKPKQEPKVPDAPMKKKSPPRRVVKPEPVEDMKDAAESEVDDLSDDASSESS